MADFALLAQSDSGEDLRMSANSGTTPDFPPRFADGKGAAGAAASLFGCCLREIRLVGK